MDNKYTQEQFLQDVANEAKLIKLHATPEEIDELNLDTFDPADSRSCIYGQMTGDCKSRRACELILLCCMRFIKNPFYNIEEGFEGIKGYVNGEKIDRINNAQDLMQDRGATINHLSAIETYIMMPKANIENLIIFLKGEGEDLVL